MGHWSAMRPNLLLVIVDALRADRTGFGGLRRAETPALDALARGGVTYTRCFSTCGWTLPACASIVTGHLPSGHGLIHHDRRFAVPKIPALLGEGWATAGIANNGNLVPDDLTREELDAAGFERRPEVWKHFGWQTGFETYRWFHKQDKDGPFRAFDSWLAERGGDARPWFAMLHTNLVHDYDEERPWTTDVARFLGAPLPASLRTFRDGPWVWKDPPDGLAHDDLAAALLAKYDGCVAEADRRIGAALAGVDLGRTVVVVVSDHGEGFDGDAGRVHHCGRLHDDLLRVPLVVHFPPGTPGAPPAGSVVDTPCSVLDVAPTLLALGGAGPAAASLPGHDLRKLPAERAIEAEDLGYLYLPAGAPAEPLRRFAYDTHDVASRAVVAWPRKTIDVRIGRQAWREVYDLELDPEERVNAAPGAQGPVRRPERRESALRAALRDRAARSGEAELVAFPGRYTRFVRRVAKQRRLPPVERHRPFGEIPGAEPITFIVAVDDPQELRRHVLVSDCYRHGGHQWLFVENRRNRAYRSISRLYVDAARRARHDLRFHVHQDVFFPPDWEERLYAALADLETRDPGRGVIGAAGRAPAAGDGSEPPDVGPWSGPHRCHRPPREGLPVPVQVLDELWLGFRASCGLAFDPDLPGFHCYGAEICLGAREAGLRSWVVDAPVVHKLVLPDGTLIADSEQSHKIEGRRTEAFRQDFLRSASYVARKYERHLPFRSTCHHYTSVAGD